MMICGVVSAASIGAVSAACAAEAPVPQVTVHYDPRNLATERGARTVYRQIVRAAEEVCPSNSASGRFLNEAVRQCRAESVARAVHLIDNQRLAEVLATSSRHG